MKCAQHVDQEAVGTCNSCGRGLCPECVSTFNPPTCGNCALAHNQGIARSFKVQLALMLVLFIATLVVLLGKLPLSTAIGYSLMAGFFPSGWNFLSKYFTPSGNYIFPAARWLNLFVQAAVAAVIGIIVGPIYLFKAWKEFKTIRATQELISERS